MNGDEPSWQVKGALGLGSAFGCGCAVVENRAGQIPHVPAHPEQLQSMTMALVARLEGLEGLRMWMLPLRLGMKGT